VTKLLGNKKVPKSITKNEINYIFQQIKTVKENKKLNTIFYNEEKIKIFK